MFGLQELQLTGSVVATRRLSICGLWASLLWHVESFQTRDQTHVLCIGSWILFHCTTREVLTVSLTKSAHSEGFPSGSAVKNLFAMQEL